MSEQDWKVRAEREAAMIIDGAGLYSIGPLARAALISVVAAGWLQGVNLGCHKTLAAAEMAFERVQAEL